MDPFPNVATASLAATHSKVVSPTVDQDMKARGVAQVIAVLAASAGAAVAVRGDGAARRVESCFRTSERSQSSAIRHAIVTRGGVAAAAVPLDQAAIRYPNLGVILGTVDAEGLARLQASDDVVSICGTPPISLIRPEHIAAATPKAGVTWGIAQLGVPAHGAVLHSALVIEGGNVVARVLGGLDWAIGTRVKIVSMSLGFRGWWEDFIPIVQIIRSRGILPVIAVGNEGPGTSRSPGNYPAALSVGAADESHAVPAFSSSQTFARTEDPRVPDLVAPGVNIISAAPGKSYQAMSGSSMATPHIAGLAALLWEAKPAATAAEIEKAIFDSCRLVGALTPDRSNRGQPDARAAFTRLTGLSLPAVAGQIAVSQKPKKQRVTRGSARGAAAFGSSGRSN